MASPTVAVRQQRLAAIANEWGVGPLPPAPRLTKPLQPFSLRTVQDDSAAEELLKRRRLTANSEGQKPTSLRRAFTTSKRKDWDPSEVFAALDAHVDQGGPAAVAEALVVKLTSAGGDLNVANTKTKTNLLTRRRSIESFERSRLLQRAIEHKNSEMVAVLVPYADTLTLDSSLPSAIQSGRADIVEHLLRYGASTANTSASQDAFRQVCSDGGRADLVALLLASDGLPGPEELSPAMVDAAKRGCFETVMQLSRAKADGSYNNAAALREAILSSRVDITLAIVTGTQPPQSTLLNSAFKILFSHPSVLPNEKMALAEILLCAGAGGDIVAMALVQSCVNNFSEMASLLVYYGASVEFDNAAVLRHTLSQKRLGLAQLLLSDPVIVNTRRASECITYLPKTVTNEERYLLLTLLLRKGAGGAPLSDCLIDVTEAGDIESAKLLLTPYFPEVTSSPVSQRAAHRRSTAQRHHTASVNHRDGMALLIAVKKANFEIVEAMLATRPSPEILATIFPNIFHLPADQRYKMVEIFLATGFSGPVVTTALQKAIQEPPQDRDQRLVTALLRAKADINFSGGAGLVSAVANGDTGLLQTILRNSQPAKEALAAAMVHASEVADPHTRRQVVYSLLAAGGSQERPAVAELLIATLNMQPVDTELVEMLLIQGKADINHNSGAAVVSAVFHSDAKMLDLLLKTKTASQDTLGRGLYSLADQPSTGVKAVKLTTLLRYTNQKEPLNDLLVSEVQVVVRAPPQQRIFSIIQALLSAGADVNAHNAAALCLAVATPIAQVVEMLLKYQPNSASLAAAIPRIFNISDAMDRFALAKMLLEAGVPTYEVSRALNHAVVNFPQDPSLLKVLAPAADPEDGSAVFSAVKSQKPELVSALLSAKQFAVPVLNAALSEAMQISEKKARQEMCSHLMCAGAAGPAVSDALLAAAADADLGLGSILLENGASADHNDGQAIVMACRSGASDVLQMLLKSHSAPKAETLSRGFEDAGKVDDLKAREAIFSLLLEQGISGDVVSKELVASAGYGDDGLDLVRLLLAYGADVDYNKGEAVRTSTRNGFMPTLKLLLGIKDENATDKDLQKSPPSQDTMVRALKISWMLKGEMRFQVIQWLFDAGLQPTEAVHIALNKAVKEDRPNMDLVRLLLEHGASSLADGCQTLVNAACRCQSDILELCTTSSTVSQADLSYALGEALNPGRVDVWLSHEGLDTAQLLLDKGAQSSDLGQVLVLCIENCSGEKSEVAKQFVQLLVKHNADVNIGNGAPLQAAAKLGDVDRVQQLLRLGPTSDSVAMAFSYIFDSNASEDDAVRLIEVFREHKINDTESGLDVMFHHPDREPVVFLAMSRYPRSVCILEALLDAGFYHDQMINVRVTPDMEEDESVSLLFWALLQPQKKISSGLIELLLQRGSKVNFETPLSMITPLMLAIQSKRPDLVQSLIREGAEVDVSDHAGNTPLFLAVRAGGDMGITMMTNILESGAELSRNDGSLHMAAQDLSLKAIKMLVKNKHDIDFPCPLYEGRSALSQICLHGTDDGPMTASRLKSLDHCISYLVDQGSDVQLRCNGKTPLLLALEAQDPVATTQALLKAGMYKFVNSPFNQYHDKIHTYSPTMYVRLVLQPPTEVREKLLAVLQMSRAEDLYFARTGPQPPDAVNVPEDLMRVERERLAQLERVSAEEQERVRARRHTEEMAQMAARARQEELQALHDRTEAEAQAARRKALAAAEAQAEAARVRAAGEALALRQRTVAEAEAAAEAVRVRARADADAYRLKAAVEAEAMQAMVLRREADHAADLEQARRLGEQDLQIEDRKQRMLLSHEQQRTAERVGAAGQLSAIAVSERRSMDKMDYAQNQRELKRLAEGRKLANAIAQLPPGQQVAGPGNRNVAGYIMGEIN
ncbi:hypothetical protein SBRCBS47491_004884 [Sporothrix bragantina]|uniref:Ankyrin repeat containing protein n=1 Tax=Sporothrix bragantina TaxID=671064 RepID=A0ABP0BSV0_9PEZI